VRARILDGADRVLATIHDDGRVVTAVCLPR
jgi:hypothetical protein